jgi:membrane protease YdiL (CAAX protease family)
MPVLGQGLLFAGAHAMQLQGALVGLVPILGVGLAAGFWRARTGGLAAPWVVHAVYNGTLVLSVFASA